MFNRKVLYGRHKNLTAGAATAEALSFDKYSSPASLPDEILQGLDSSLGPSKRIALLKEVFQAPSGLVVAVRMQNSLKVILGLVRADALPFEGIPYYRRDASVALWCTLAELHALPWDAIFDGVMEALAPEGVTRLHLSTPEASTATDESMRTCGFTKIGAYRQLNILGWRLVFWPNDPEPRAATS